MSNIDVLLITPPSRLEVYQGLSNEYAAIEPPVWSSLIANYLLKRNYNVQILDAEADNLTHEQTAKKIISINPKLAVFMIYGQQPSASTQCMPGIKIASPMTPKEYLSIYDNFMKNDDVLYVSEHRGSYSNTDELKDFVSENLDIILFPISITRFEAQRAKIELEKHGYKIGIANILWIKPFVIKREWENAVKTSKFGGIVLDDDYSQGVATNLAYDIMKKTGKKIDIMGLKNKSAGFSKETDNLPPNSSEIVERVKKIIKS